MTLLLGIVPSNRVLSTTLLFFISYIGLVCPIAQAQGCKQWTDVLLNGFMPRQDNLNSLRNMVDMSPDQYAQLAFNAEKKAAEQVLSTRVRIPAVEDQLRNALQRFYDVGYQLYGVRLDANNFFIISRMDPNAFATGSAIFLHKGLVDYYLNPTGYLVEIGFFPHSGYTVEQYNWLMQNFPWQTDWNSLYFVLAHEASHNLMRHRDEKIVGSLRKEYQSYRQAVSERRKDIAEGKEGGGARRYIWHSLQNVLAQYSVIDQYRGVESEADSVALVLLQRSGVNPTVSVTASERLSLLISVLSQPQGGWQGAVNDIMCSDHPAWVQRIQQESSNLDCLNFSGKLCQQHVPFSANNFLAELKQGTAGLENYDEETDKIAASTVDTAGAHHNIEIKVEPKGAKMTVDGLETSQGNVGLAVGPHLISASKDGFETTTRRIVVFPDVQAKVKVKLKKAK